MEQLSHLPPLPGCGKPATVRYELYADWRWSSLDGTIALCDAHDQSGVLQQASGLAPFRTAIVPANQRCGDGFDFLAQRAIHAPVDPSPAAAEVPPELAPLPRNEHGGLDLAALDAQVGLAPMTGAEALDAARNPQEFLAAMNGVFDAIAQASRDEADREDADPECDGRCVDSADLGVPGYGIAYPDPDCSLHGRAS